MTRINWKIKSEEEFVLLHQVAQRAYEADKNGVWEDYMECIMDITACHLNGTPLKLEELLKAKDFDFFHDVFGICRHINRQTGKLENMFSPRYHA